MRDVLYIDELLHCVHVYNIQYLYETLHLKKNTSHIVLSKIKTLRYYVY